MTDKIDNDLLEKHTDLHAQWCLAATMVKASSFIMNDYDFDSKDDLKLIITSLHESLRVLVNVYETETPFMELLEIFKRLDYVEEVLDIIPAVFSNDEQEQS